MPMHYVSTNFNLSYEADLQNLVCRAENERLWTGNGGNSIHFVGGNPTIGFGLDLRENPAWLNQIGSYIEDEARRPTADDIAMVTAYLNQTEYPFIAGYGLDGQPQINIQVPTEQQVIAAWSHVRVTRDEALALFEELRPVYEEMLDNYIGSPIPESLERIALLSIVYNTGAAFPQTRDLINNEESDLIQHARIYAEIRYDTNQERNTNLGNGIQNRRDAESSLFGIAGKDRSLTQFSIDELVRLGDLFSNAAYSNAITNQGIANTGVQGQTYADQFKTDLLDITHSLLANIREELGYRLWDKIQGEYYSVFQQDGGTINAATIPQREFFGENDILAGSSADEIFIGGQGDDILIGRGGVDTFVFSGEFGRDTVWGGESSIIDLTSFAFADFSLSYSGDYIQITHMHSQSSVGLIVRALEQNYVVNFSDQTINNIREASGTPGNDEYDLPVIPGLDYYAGAGDDNIRGILASQRIYGQEGNDRIDIDNGRGAYGGDGDDVIFAAAIANDDVTTSSLSSAAAYQVIEGGESDYRVFDGGAGDDRIYYRGGIADKTKIFLGEGNDNTIISFSEESSALIEIDTGGGKDFVLFEGAGAGGTIHIPGSYTENFTWLHGLDGARINYVTNSSGYLEIRFDSVTAADVNFYMSGVQEVNLSRSIHELFALVTYENGESLRIVFENYYDDPEHSAWVHKLPGDWKNNITIISGSNTWALHAESVDFIGDSVNGDTGDDVITAEFGGAVISPLPNGENGGAFRYGQFIDGGAGDDYLIGRSEDFLYGGEGADVIRSGDGSFINPGEGEDIIYLTGRSSVSISAGDGRDYIEHGESDYSLSILIIDESISKGQLEFLRWNDDLLLKSESTGNEVYVRGAFSERSPIAGVSFQESRSFLKIEDIALLAIYSSEPFNWAVIGDDLIKGTETADEIYGGHGNDILWGNSSGDLLVGGAGKDTILMGTGDDTALGGSGADTIIDTGDIVNGLLHEFDPQDGNDEFYGEEGNDTLIARYGNNLLYGGAGDDYLFSGEGRDELNGDDGDDSLYASLGTGMSVLNGGKGNDKFYLRSASGVIAFGGAGEDVFYTEGTGGGGVISGGESADRYYIHGAYTIDDIEGDDAYHIYAAGVSILDNHGSNNYYINIALDWQQQFGESSDHIEFSGTIATLMLGDGDDSFIGTGIFEILGEDGDDSITTADGDDIVSGGAGHDIINTVGGSDTINGNEGNDQIQAGDGNDILNGGTGVDTLYGGFGNDVYVVDDAADLVVEAAGEGIDRVSSSISWTLGDNLENLTLTGNAANNGAGNAGNNVLQGNTANNILRGGAGNDTINGGSGVDTLYGGLGNDVYVVDNSLDQIVENADEGIDRVSCAISWTLGDNLENLTLTGSAAINGTGNAGNNALQGNSANNILRGGAGNDTLNGGSGADSLFGAHGNDTYVVDNALDQIVENADEGIDRVNSTISWALGDNLENLTLTGSAAIDGTGNSLNNILQGNAADNVLHGMMGNDTLRGGSGNDAYVFMRNDGVDRIVESDATEGNQDLALFGDGISHEQLWFRRSSSHLEVSIIGSDDKLIVQNWYLGEQYRVEQFKTVDGSTLLNSQVQQLVDAMASFAPPLPGQTVLPESYQAALASVIAVNWQ